MCRSDIRDGKTHKLYENKWHVRYKEKSENEKYVAYILLIHVFEQHK